MKRSELVRLFVLNHIADDYENVDQMILNEVAEVGAKCGLTVERTEVVGALAGLIEGGLAKAYLLSTTAPPIELQGMPVIDIVEENFTTYFYITKKGVDLIRSDETWPPFDDEGNLRPDWNLNLSE